MDINNIPLPSTGKTARKKTDQTAKASKYPQGYFKAKDCKICSISFTPNAPSEHYCSDSCAEEALATAWLYRNYSITLKDYKDIYISQNGECAICGFSGYTTNTARSLTMPLVIDHNHTTGKVRGLLCHTCNTALGQLNDSIDVLHNAINYLQQPDKVFTTDTSKLVQRPSRDYSVPDDTILSILVDHLDNGLKRREIATKYNISESIAKAIMNRSPYAVKRVYEFSYLSNESPTTIPNGSTLEANASGSGEPLPKWRVKI